MQEWQEETGHEVRESSTAEDGPPGPRIFLIASAEELIRLRREHLFLPFTTDFREASPSHGIPAKSGDGHFLVCHCLTTERTRLAFYAPNEMGAAEIRHDIERSLYDPHLDNEAAY